MSTGTASPALWTACCTFRTNVAALLRHWHGEIGSFALLDVLQPPGGSYDTEGNPQPWRPLPDSIESQGHDEPEGL
jgi:hypothetical protein